MVSNRFFSFVQPKVRHVAASQRFVGTDTFFCVTDSIASIFVCGFGPVPGDPDAFGLP